MASLNWPRFLSLRKQRKRIGTIVSIPSTIAGLTVGINYFASIEAEPTQLIMGIEPVYAYGLATVSCAGLGWLVGPSIGNVLWRT